METLAILEERITALIQTIKELKAENVALFKEKEQLLHHIETIENSLLKNSKNIEDLNQEKQSTKEVVDALIMSIEDLLATKENQS